MRTAIKQALAITAGGGIALAPALLPGTASAAGRPATVYVSPSGTPGAAGISCQSAAYSVINDAIAAVAEGGTVVVCKGTYHQSPTVDKTVTLQGQPGAVIDQSGLTFPEGGGIYVTADSVTVRRLTVEHGSGGIWVSGNHATITGNTLMDMVSHPGEGIAVSGSYALVSKNMVKGVGGFGITLQDFLGFPPNPEPGQPPASHNQIIGNRVEGTVGTAIGLHSFIGDGGVFANIISNNVVDNTTTAPDTPGGQGGPGVMMGTADTPCMLYPCGESAPTTNVPTPSASISGVYNNTVEHNRIYENGWPGVMIIGPLPDSGYDMNGNVVTANSIGTNNLLGVNLRFISTEVLETTGIMVASPTLLSTDLVGNVIYGNHYGIWKNSLVVAPSAAQANHFANVTVPVYTAP